MLFNSATQKVSFTFLVAIFRNQYECRFKSLNVRIAVWNNIHFSSLILALAVRKLRNTYFNMPYFWQMIFLAQQHRQDKQNHVAPYRDLWLYLMFSGRLRMVTSTQKASPSPLEQTPFWHGKWCILLTSLCHWCHFLIRCYLYYWHFAAVAKSY